MKSETLKIYDKWLTTAMPEQIELVDGIYHECEQHYEDGGDTIVECFTPDEVLEEFKTIAEAKAFCGLKVEQATNCRSGDDNDPELERLKNFEKW